VNGSVLLCLDSFDAVDWVSGWIEVLLVRRFLLAESGMWKSVSKLALAGETV